MMLDNPKESRGETSDRTDRPDSDAGEREETEKLKNSQALGIVDHDDTSG